MSSARSIELSHFLDGVDRKALNVVRERFLAVNSGRLARWRETAGDRQQQYLTLLPLLLHINHPMLPGYASGSCPSTIHGYDPDEAVLREARTLARSFQYQNRPRSADIVSVFLMGSCGTVAQTPGSDLDFWVCVRDDLSTDERSLLDRKLERLTQWGRALEVESHFFVMSAVAFRRGDSAGLTAEDCGATQHVLLLDEFYRTSLFLAGAYPIWWMVPVALEAGFDELASMLRDRRYLRAEDTIDFGGVANIDAAEFVGAGQWQLFKGIEYPYKSVLKILLAEVYASEYPQVDCVSLAIKRTIYAGTPALDVVDPYVVLYRKVEAYLRHRKEEARLELARQCFYFKVGESLSKSSGRTGWRRSLLETLVADWGWDRTHLQRLDCREKWKIMPVIDVHQQLVGELTHSYRILSSFARNQAEDRMSVRQQEDMALLGRRLHAAFERKAGKIDRVNPNIASSLAEQFLMVSRQRGEQGMDLWGLYDSQRSEYLPEQALKRAFSVVELMVWAHCNGVLGKETQLQGNEGAISRNELMELTQALRQLVGDEPILPDTQKLMHAAAAERVLLCVNVGVDPQGALAKRGLTRISQQNNVLAYGGVQEDLLQTVDMVIRNSWEEVLVSRFAQGQPLLAALRHLMQQLSTRYTGRLPQIEVIAPGGSGGTGAGEIIPRVREVVAQVLKCFYVDKRISARFIVQSGHAFYVLSMTEGQVQLQRYADLSALYEGLSQARRDFGDLVVDARSLSEMPLAAMTRHDDGQAVRVFYQLQGAQAEIWIFDECNALAHFYMEVDEADFLVPIRRFLRSVMERQKTMRNVFVEGLPGCKDPDLIWYEVQGRPGRFQLQRKQVMAGYQDRKFLHVQALAHAPDEGGGFSIVCEGREFTTAQYGADLPNVVAGYIATQRGSGQDYPIYVTDLDLTALHAGSDHPLPLITYLRYKRELESQLTTALRQRTKPHSAG